MSVVMRAKGQGNQAECQFVCTGVGKTDVKVKLQFAAPSGTQLSTQPANTDLIGPSRPPMQQIIKMQGNNLALKIKFQYVLPSGQPKEQLLTINHVLQ